MIDIFQGVAKGVGDWMERRGRRKEAKLSAEIRMMERQAEAIATYDIEAQRAKRYTIMDELAGLVIIATLLINFVPILWPETASQVDEFYTRLEDAPLIVLLPYLGFLASTLGLRWLVEAFIGKIVKGKIP